MLINDVGGGQREEVNPGVAGANYGWPTTEGDFNPTTYPVHAPALRLLECRQPRVRHHRRHLLQSGDARRFRRPTPAPTSSRTSARAGSAASTPRRCCLSQLPTAVGLRHRHQLAGRPEGGERRQPLLPVARQQHGVPRAVRQRCAPSITSHPANRTVSPGQSASFTVVAGGTAPFTYRWQRNNVDIPGAAGAGATYTLAVAATRRTTARASA